MCDFSKVAKQKYYENMQQIYWRTPMAKCDSVCRSVNADIGTLLSICCIFSEHLFYRTPMDNRQGTILDPLLFNIFINDIPLFVSSSKLGNYADDNTLYAAGFNAEEVKTCLSDDFDAFKKWFY